MKIGIIGYGAIGAALHRALVTQPSVELACVLTQANRVAATRAALPDVTVTDDWDHFLACRPSLTVECAGHAALGCYGALVLRSGCDLVVCSVGALAEKDLERQLKEAATASGSRVIVPAGAAGGLDALGAARRSGGLDQVRYTSRKHPAAWRGTAAEGLIDLQAVQEAQSFFSGDARTAALMFPQNANVVAAIALAGRGFERTHVTLIADPATPGNRHTIEASGSFGEITSSVMSRVLPENSKTSMLAPFSVVRSILGFSEWIVV